MEGWHFSHMWKNVLIISRSRQICVHRTSLIPPTCHFEIYRSIGMIQLIFFSLCFSAGWSILPGYSEYKSEYCPRNSAKFSDDCKMEMRCTNSASTYIQRCSAYGYRLKNEECYSYRWSNYVRRLSTDVICRQNLKGKTAVHSTHMGLLDLQSGPFIPSRL